jgi:hypothetical protein
LLLSITAFVAAQPKPTELGSMPSKEQFPTVEFVFEERVTLGPAVVLGQTDKGHRQFIPITGGTIAGRKLKGKVRPGGWDYQGRFEGGCLSMSADYFLTAQGRSLGLRFRSGSRRHHR